MHTNNLNTDRRNGRKKRKKEKTGRGRKKHQRKRAGKKGQRAKRYVLRARGGSSNFGNRNRRSVRGQDGGRAGDAGQLREDFSLDIDVLNDGLGETERERIDKNHEADNLAHTSMTKSVFLTSLSKKERESTHTGRGPDSQILDDRGAKDKKKNGLEIS
jgi:hypothetical protein